MKITLTQIRHIVFAIGLFIVIMGGLFFNMILISIGLVIIALDLTFLTYWRIMNKKELYYDLKRCTIKQIT